NSTDPHHWLLRFQLNALEPRRLRNSMLLADWLLIVLAVVVTLPMVLLGCESLLPALPRRARTIDVSTPRPRCAVVIPAHNEPAGFGDTTKRLQPQSRPGDRLIVVADNCSDSTAAAAREAGAEVIERQDAERRGKGFALDFGLKHLEADPPAVVVVID